jgi:hypothetical protein
MAAESRSDQGKTWKFYRAAAFLPEYAYQFILRNGGQENGERAARIIEAGLWTSVAEG